MPVLKSVIDKFQLSNKKNTALIDENLFQFVFDYYTSSDVLDDYQQAVTQLDVIGLNEDYQWLLFTGFRVLTQSDFYNDECRDKLCRFWLPVYQKILQQLVSSEISRDKGQTLPLNGIKYLIINLIEMQQTLESMFHLLKSFTEFQNFTHKNEYLSIIQTIIPLLNNKHILHDIKTDNQKSIRLELNPNNPSNTENITSTFIYWLIIKLIMIYIKSDPECLTLIKYETNLKDNLLKSMKYIADDKIVKLSAYALLILLINEEDIKEQINDPNYIITLLVDNVNQTLNDQSLDSKVNIDGVYIVDLMLALKAFLQHDQVKNVFLNQDGFDFLIELIKGITEISTIDFDNMIDWDTEMQSLSVYGLENQIDSDMKNEIFEKFPQIKENFINDMQKLVEEIGLIALECIYVMSFDRKALDLLKKNSEFKTNIKNLANDNSITDERIKKTVDGLLWKLEKEDQFIKEHDTKTTNQQDHPFDLMISYSWNDKDIIQNLYQSLTEKFQYKIWLDENQMSGSLCKSMAEAIEKSQIILLCMSETYKTSENCRNEAEYARDRKKILIPLVIKNVERDGWLGFLIAGKLYIDFLKQDFQKAVLALNEEIKRYNQNNIHAIKSTNPVNNVEPIKSNQPPNTQTAKSNNYEELNGIKTNNSDETNSPPLKTIKPAVEVIPNGPIRPDIISDDYKQIPIESWSEQDVQDFLYDNKLDLMVLLTENLNGDDICLLLQKCQNEGNSWATFDRLNKEMEQRHKKTLPISLYLKFINQTQKFITVSSF